MLQEQHVSGSDIAMLDLRNIDNASEASASGEESQSRILTGDITSDSSGSQT